MPIFNYKAIDKFGKEITGEIEVNSYDDAIKKIRNLGFFPTQVIVKKEKGKVIRGKLEASEYKRPLVHLDIRIPLFGIGIVKAGQLTTFTRQLATLIGAGLPLVRSLNILRDQLKYSLFKDVINNLSQQVEAGGTFSEALARYPHIFSKLYVNTIKAGEVGGVLEGVLTRLADFNEKSEKLRARVKAALIYPLFVITIALGVLSFLIIFIIPKFMELYEDIGTELPLPTLVLVRVTSFLQRQWIIGVIALVLLIFLYNFMKRFIVIRVLFDRLKLRVPVFGLLIQKLCIARFARTLGTLISSGVPILQAIMITKDTAGNEVIARSLARVHDSIREGESISGPLSKTKIFPLIVVNMINVGEETGALDQMLNKIADTYDDEVDTTVSALTSLLEPMLILFMGLIVGSIVIAMFLPLVKLLTTLSA